MDAMNRFSVFLMFNRYYLTQCFSKSVPGRAALTLPKNLLEMQFLGPNLNSIKIRILRDGP